MTPAETRESVQFTWRILSRLDNQPVCDIEVSHDGPPNVAEVVEACGPDLFQQRQNTPECTSDLAGNAPCGAIYLELESTQAVAAKDQAFQPAGSLQLVGCTRSTQAWICGEEPILRLVAEQQQAEDPIAAINVAVDGSEMDCTVPACDVPLPPTPEEGVEVIFSLTTTSGARSLSLDARVRVVMAPLEPGAGPPVWQVEILSSQFEDDRMDQCGLAWDALPVLRDRPSWLSLPEGSDDLRTSTPYAFLGERLSSQAGVGEGFASDKRLLASANSPNVEEGSETLIDKWQNQFDAPIVEAASSRGLPPILVKSLFAAESQFWPGSYPEVDEVGLGHMSPLGADTLLLWSPPFFARFCPEVLHPSTCGQGYSQMPEDQKDMLRAALLGEVNSDCADCPYGLDLDKAERSVSIFAETLTAYCTQTGRVVANATGNTPGLLSSYEDLWRFTLANYNAGSGCLTRALSTTWRLRQAVDWSHVAANLPRGCQSAIAYVSKVLGESPVETTARAEEALANATGDALVPAGDSDSSGDPSRQ